MVRKRLTQETTTLLTSDQFKRSVIRGDAPGTIPLLRKQYATTALEQDEEENSRKITFTITTEAKDRDGDIIRSDGIDTTQFEANPVVLFAHDARRPPIGRAINIDKGSGAIAATAEFMDNDVDTSGFSDMIFRMVRSGFLRATSIGFIPTKFEFLEDEEDEGSDPFGFFVGFDFTESELLEFSIVPVPANPEALVDARRAGIDINPLEHWLGEALDGWATYKECLLVPRASAECWYKLATSAVNKQIVTATSQGIDSVKELEELLEVEDEDVAVIEHVDVEEDEELDIDALLEDDVLDDEIEDEEEDAEVIVAEGEIEESIKEDDDEDEETSETHQHTMTITGADGTTTSFSTTDVTTLTQWSNEYTNPQSSNLFDITNGDHPEIAVLLDGYQGVAPSISASWEKDESGRYVVVVRVAESDVVDDDNGEPLGEEKRGADGEIPDDVLVTIPTIVKEVIKDEMDRLRGKVK